MIYNPIEFTSCDQQFVQKTFGSVRPVAQISITHVKLFTRVRSSCLMSEIARHMQTVLSLISFRFINTSSGYKTLSLLNIITFHSYRICIFYIDKAIFHSIKVLNFSLWISHNIQVIFSSFLFSLRIPKLLALNYAYFFLVNCNKRSNRHS